MRDVDEPTIIAIAQRRANAEQQPVHLYGFVEIFEDENGDLRAGDAPTWMLRTDLDNAERGEPTNGFLWDTIDPNPERFALTAKSRRALEEDAELIDELEKRYLRTLGYKKELPELDEEEEQELVREKLPATVAGRRQIESGDPELEQVVLALNDLFDDPEFAALLEPYVSESKWDTRAKLGAVTGVIDSFIAGMLESEGAIDVDGLKAAFADYLANIEEIKEKRARPEVAKQTISAFSYPVSRSRSSRGTYASPRWEGVKPESMHGKRFLSQEDLPMLERVKRIQEQRIADRKLEAEARRRSYREKQRQAGREFTGKYHPGGTYSASTRKTKKKRRRR